MSIGPVAIDRAEQPSIGRVTERRTVRVSACQPNPVILRMPRVPWRVEVTVDPPFVPRELDPNQPDARRLGAKIAFAFVPFEELAEDE